MEKEVNKIEGFVNHDSIKKAEDKYVDSTSQMVTPIESSIAEKENDWNSKRRMYYIIGIILIILSFLFYKSYDSLFPEATCFDKKQNNQEVGIDCGGSCELLCKNTFLPLEIKLAKAYNSGFDIEGKQKYNMLILLDNKNIEKSPKKLIVSVDVFGSNGEKLDSFKKETAVTSYNKIPVIIEDYVLPQSVTDKSVVITKLFVTLLDEHNFYLNRGYYDISLLDYRFENGNTPKLEIEYTSPYKETVRGEIEVLVLLKDNLDNVVHYNIRKINGLTPERKEKLSFTWKQRIEENVISVEVIPLTYLFYTK
jgi:hypothetical protein